MDYAAKFNELSRFAPHQVNIEERKMDHFKQGLRADIKSVTACQNFDHFQEMYQRAIKIARVMEETERENQARSLEKQKREIPTRNFQSGNNKRIKPNAPLGKGKQPMTGQVKPYCRRFCKNHGGVFLFKGGVRCFEYG